VWKLALPDGEVRADYVQCALCLVLRPDVGPVGTVRFVSLRGGRVEPLECRVVSTHPKSGARNEWRFATMACGLESGRS
jgi:hypothetical protein